MSHPQPIDPAASRADKSHIGLGLVSMATGLVAGLTAWGYGIGTVTEMGPGFFPLMVSILLAGLGGVLILRRGGDLPPHADNGVTEQPASADRGVAKTLRVLGAVLGGILVFALCIGPLGLFLSVVLLSAISSLGHPGVRPLPILLLSVGLATGSVLIFVFALKLNINALPGLF